VRKRCGRGKKGESFPYPKKTSAIQRMAHKNGVTGGRTKGGKKPGKHHHWGKRGVTPSESSTTWGTGDNIRERKKTGFANGPRRDHDGRFTKGKSKLVEKHQRVGINTKKLEGVRAKTARCEQRKALSNDHRAPKKKSRRRKRRTKAFAACGRRWKQDLQKTEMRTNARRKK